MLYSNRKPWSKTRKIRTKKKGCLRMVDQVVESEHVVIHPSIFVPCGPREKL